MRPLDPISRLKNGARVVFARGLSALGRSQEAAESARERALHRAGLPTRTDLDRLEEAVADLDRATDSLRVRS